MNKANKGFTPLQIAKSAGNNKFVMGFTLVEIMVVVVIMLILVTLAVPGMLRSRITANEGAAIANLKTLANACQSYSTNAQAYPNNLSDLVPPNSIPPYIDSALASGTKQGYQYTYIPVDATHFTINADPVGLLKGRYFYTDETGVIRANPDNQAGPNDQSVG